MKRYRNFFPELIQGIANNEYIGFIVVRSSEKGDWAFGKNGTYYLGTGEIDAKNPRDGFGKNIVQHLKRNSSFRFTLDILVNCFYNEEIIGAESIYRLLKDILKKLKECVGED